MRKRAAELRAWETVPGLENRETWGTRQKRLPDQHRHLFRPPLETLDPTRQKTLSPSARHPQPQRAQSGHEIALVVAIAIIPALASPPLISSPARKAVSLSLRLQFQEPLPSQLRLAVHIAPETLFHLRQKMLEMLGDRCNLRHGCKLLSENGFCLSGKANLHPLVFTQ